MVVELVDTPDSKSGERIARAGSSPAHGTKKEANRPLASFLMLPLFKSSAADGFEFFARKPANPSCQIGW